MFTARYELGIQLKQIHFRPSRVNLLVTTAFKCEKKGGKK